MDLRNTLLVEPLLHLSEKLGFLKVEGNINPEDLDLVNIVETPEEAVKVIDDFYSRFLLSPNF